MLFVINWYNNPNNNNNFEQDKFITLITFHSLLISYNIDNL